ncbi:hypothetical protein ACM43_04870 [Bradyrhizobium sp. CCBAU 45321]|uniref:hypothetical protein n=1 Tax=Bradyrhizobium sp. CCBAU 45321 TaxID=1641878 RepID=UPI002304252B|nr:hypothetical protein [Bradyrhizobium sp. CCBAU 45321]MDA9543895.1 hypothetical protein [Bradyrhizobium sp. CCBAU 45321]
MANMLLFESSEAELHPDLFSLPPLTRFVYQHFNCFDEMQARDVMTALQRRIDLFQHGTTNHALMSASSWYLLAQKFPSNRWVTREGKVLSSRQVQTEYKRLLLQTFARWLSVGNVEQYSPVYAVLDLIPLLNVIEYSEDAQLKSAANAVANVIIATLWVNSFEGLVVPPIIRAYRPQLYRNVGSQIEQRDSPGLHINWLYFGAPVRLARDFLARGEPLYVGFLATSNWMPDSIVLELIDVRVSPYRLQSTIPAFTKWGAVGRTEAYGNAYFNSDYAIGSGTFRVSPFMYNASSQSFAIFFRAGLKYPFLECYHSYWSANEGTKGLLQDRMSPFQESIVDEDRGMIVYRIPARDPFRASSSNAAFRMRSMRAEGLIHSATCRFPAELTVRASSGLLLLDAGPIYVALRYLSNSKKGGELTDQGEFSYFEIEGTDIVVYFRVFAKKDAPSQTEILSQMEGVVLSSEQNGNFAAIDGNVRYDLKYQLIQEGAGEDFTIAAIPEVRKNLEPFPFILPEKFVSSPRLEGGRDGVLIRGHGREVAYKVSW